MKKLVYLGIMVMGMVSCSEYGSEYEEKKPTLRPVQNDTIYIRDTITNNKTDTLIVEAKDSIPAPEPEAPVKGWASWLDRTFKVTDTKGMHNPAESRILVQDQNGKEIWLNMDFDFIVEVPDTLWLTEKSATRFHGAEQPIESPDSFSLNGSVYSKDVVLKTCFNTNNFSKTITLRYKQGYTLVKGAQLFFKPERAPIVSRKSFTTRNEEITKDRKIYNREISDLIVNISIEQYNLTRTTTTVIDHYVKDVEEEEETPADDPETPAEPEPTTPTTPAADFYVNGLKGFISCTKVWRDDTNSWSDAYLFECEQTYEIILDNYRVNDRKESFVSREHKSVSKTTCPYSQEYNAVLCDKGQFYPALITMNNGGWMVVSQPNGGVLTQSHQDGLAVTQGIKNMRVDNDAQPTPFIPNTPEVKEVNGKKVITVVSQTSTHSGKVVVADKE